MYEDGKPSQPAAVDNALRVEKSSAIDPKPDSQPLTDEDSIPSDNSAAIDANSSTAYPNEQPEEDKRNPKRDEQVSPEDEQKAEIVKQLNRFGYIKADDKSDGGDFATVRDEFLAKPLNELKEMFEEIQDTDDEVRVQLLKDHYIGLFQKTVIQKIIDKSYQSPQALKAEYDQLFGQTNLPQVMTFDQFVLFKATEQVAQIMAGGDDPFPKLLSIVFDLEGDLADQQDQSTALPPVLQSPGPDQTQSGQQQTPDSAETAASTQVSQPAPTTSEGPKGPEKKPEFAAKADELWLAMVKQGFTLAGNALKAGADSSSINELFDLLFTYHSYSSGSGMANFDNLKSLEGNRTDAFLIKDFKTSMKKLSDKDDEKEQHRDGVNKFCLAVRKLAGSELGVAINDIWEADDSSDDAMKKKLEGLYNLLIKISEAGKAVELNDMLSSEKMRHELGVKTSSEFGFSDQHFLSTDVVAYLATLAKHSGEFSAFMGTQSS